MIASSRGGGSELNRGMSGLFKIILKNFVPFSHNITFLFAIGLNSPNHFGLIESLLKLVILFVSEQL